MMPEKVDAIIIGAGHNGLVCAAYLAKHGLKPLVLERRPVVGGAAVTQQIAPGFRASTFSYLMSLLHPRIQAELDLKRHGLQIMPCSDMLAPLDDGNYIVFSDSVERTQASFARFNEADARIYPEFDRFLNENARLFRRLLWETPFDPTGRDWRTFKQAAGFVYRNWRIGSKAFRVLDMLSMSAYDFLSEWFSDDRIKAVLAYYASIGTFAGPKTPGSAYIIMHHIMGEHAGAGGWGFVRGGMGSISKAIARSGERFGLKIRTDAEVASIDTSGGRVTGVTTADGARYEAPIVASNASCKVTFLKLLPESVLPADFVQEIRGYRTFATSFKINIACERLPQYKAFDAAACGFPYPTYTHIGPDIDYLERAYEEAK